MKELTSKFWESLENESFDETIQLAEKNISKNPNSGHGYYLLGHHYYAQNNIEEAIQNFEISINKSDNDSSGGYSSYWLGVIYGEYSFPENDLSFYDREKSVQAYKAALGFDNFPENTILQLYMYCKSEPEEGLKILKRGFQFYPDNIDYKFLEIDVFYSIYKDVSRVRALCQELIDTNAPSTFPALVLLLGTINHKDDVLGENIVVDVLTKMEEDSLASTLSYEYGRILMNVLGNQLEAEKQFRLALNKGTGNEVLFSIYSLIEYYINKEDNSKLISLIEGLDIDKLFIFLDGPRFSFLGGTRIYYDPVEYYDSKSLISRLEEIDFDSTVRFKGKLDFLLGVMTFDLSKFEKAFQYFQNAFSLLRLKELINYQTTAAGELIENTKKNKQSLTKLNKSIISAISSSREFKKDFKLIYFDELISSLKEKKLYEQLCDLATCYNSKELESNELFDFAYAASQCQKDNLAFELYTTYLDIHERSSAVLNNLGNLYKQKGDRKTALMLYIEAVQVDPDNKIAEDNIKSINKEDSKKKEEEEYEKSRLHLHKIAAQNILNENKYVLLKIKEFIANWTEDPRFKNGKGPLPSFAFPKYFKADPERAMSLRQQMIDKSYLLQTDERDQHNARFYQINPYLIEELKKADKLINQIVSPDWEKNFQNINIEKLKEIDYFKLSEKINRINKKYSSLVERDFQALVLNYLMKQNKAVVVLSGSLIELVLLYFYERKGIDKIEYTDSKTTKSIKKKIYRADLIDLISYAVEKNLFGTDFSHLSNLLRVYRNYIHPGMELRANMSKLDIGKSEVSFFGAIEVMKRVIK